MTIMAATYLHYIFLEEVKNEKKMDLFSNKKINFILSRSN